MNSPARVISFVNAAHFIDHYSMLIFAAAVIVMGPALGMAYSELLPYATPGFVAFGAGSLLTGWLGDRWSRRHMMVIFFVGIGASMIAVGLVRTPLQLGAALLSIGLFASIYHPVGTARMSVSPKEGVLNSFCQTHDIANLYVFGGNAFPSTGDKHPTLTMMALTARGCDHLLDQARGKKI